MVGIMSRSPSAPIYECEREFGFELWQHELDVAGGRLENRESLSQNLQPCRPRAEIVVARQNHPLS